MKLEMIMYSGEAVASIRDSLPDFVKNAAMMKVPYHRNKDVLEFNLKNKEVIEYLDKQLHQAIVERRCERHYFIEIDKKEIPNYSYFDIEPTSPEPENFLVADERMPTCPTYANDYEKKCYVGARMLSPIKVKYDRASKYDIAELFTTWQQEKVLLLSERLKNAFEMAGVSGLVYEPVEFFSRVSGRSYERINGICKSVCKIKPVEGPTQPYFAARLTHSIYCYAPRPAEFPKIICELHKTISFIGRFPGRQISMKDIDGYDFVQVCGVKIDGETFNFNRYGESFLCVSRKLLEILLNYKAKGLCSVGVITKSKFGPVTNIME